MGKALIMIVLGAGIILTQQFWSTRLTEDETSEDRRDYQETVISREIAASAFNVAMGEIRAYGEDLKTAVEDFNGTTEGRSGVFLTGRFSGGTYETTSHLTSGHSVRVVAKGVFDGAEFVMHDEYRVPVLVAREEGIVEITPQPTMPGRCSAVFYQAYPLNADAADLPEPEMIYASSASSRVGDSALQSVYVTAGTQMNFFIAVDAGCVMQFSSSTTECGARLEAANYSFDASDWNEIHWALDVDPTRVDQAEEAPWAFVEQDAGDRQSWRISWEDTHDWNAPTEASPSSSVQALKRLGYGGNGWSLSGSAAYVSLTDLGASAPDFADQSIMVAVYGIGNPNYHGKQQSTLTRQKHCGETYDQPVDGNDYDVDNDGVADVEPNTSSDPTMPDDDVLTEFACDCTSNGTKDHKTAILHRPPGNESNEQLICIGTPAVDDHFDNHNDVFPTCEGRRNVRANNARKNKK